MNTAQIAAQLVEAGHPDLAEGLVEVSGGLLIEDSTNLNVGAMAFDVFDEITDQLDYLQDEEGVTPIQKQFGKVLDMRKPWAAKLEAMAEKKYRADKKFAKQMRKLTGGNKNREILGLVMKEWTLELLKKMDPELHKLIPRSYYKKPVKF